MRGAIRRSVGLVMATGLLASMAAPAVFAADTAIDIADFAFPATTTVNAGDTVTWSNTSGVVHTATADDGSFDTGSISDGASGSVTFDEAGTFPYHCTIHASMTGSIVVAAATGGGGPTVTPAPTDTAPPPDPPRGDTTALVLAVLGIAMLVGTYVADRRFGHAHATEIRSEDED
jgi:plastocyanin